LFLIVECATEFNRALHQGIVGYEGVRPYGLNQFLLADQPPGVFHQVLEGLVYLGAKLDFIACLEHTSPGHIERELAEVIFQGTGPHGAPPETQATGGLSVISVFLWRCFVTAHLPACYFAIGKRDSALCAGSSSRRTRPTVRILAKPLAAKKP